jgi:hypothetical protein
LSDPGTPTSGTVHAVFAALGYATLATVPLAASRRLLADGHPSVARVSIVVGLATGALLAASAVGAPAHGLTQRAGLSSGDAWVLVSSATILLAPKRRHSGSLAPGHLQ